MGTRRGFSMAELMVSVAIIGVLSAIAIPAWQDSQFRTKRAEIPANVAGIREAELGYYAAWSKFVGEDSFHPRALTSDGDDRLPVPWVGGSTAGGFDDLGWAPSGTVRGVYAIQLGETGEFQIDAACNVDGNSDIAFYVATESVEGTWVNEEDY